MTTDMTSGSAYRHLWRYALPLMLGNWFQLCYNAADSVIAGRFIGAHALAAEGAAGPVMNLVILAISGVTVRAGVLMSEFFGARDGQRLRHELATTLLAGLWFSAAVAGLGLVFTPPLLRWLAVPAHIFPITVLYLRITFLGAPFTCFYNILAAGLKSVGDARTPLRFLMISSLLNILLDLVFIGWLGFGIACSAATTVAAEAVSAALAVERVGMPESQIILAHAAAYIACAPKSNAAVCAIAEAMKTVEETGNLPVPAHLQDAHYKGAAKLGHGLDYKYAHNYPNNYVEQQYLPYELSGREFYRPSGNGYEVKIREHMKRIRKEAAENGSGEEPGKKRPENGD